MTHSDQRRRWRVPRYLDEKTQILIFSLPEAGLIAALFVLGLVLDQLLLSLILAAVLIVLLRYLKKRLHVSSGLLALVYWCSFYKIQPHMPDSWQRFWRG